ncbi:hypothetical protein HHK36_009763 [Tetracentron sinense]|uniref:Uncharacterized protein n=1 Tax=Tetracentron sinense TaxID=13715 RepID=A0A834ZM26_TETSI|nr:hypothetical protein HHK36_009763 [Tetracentron sinense]
MGWMPSSLSSRPVNVGISSTRWPVVVKILLLYVPANPRWKSASMRLQVTHLLAFVPVLEFLCEVVGAQIKYVGAYLIISTMCLSVLSHLLISYAWNKGAGNLEWVNEKLWNHV